MKVRGKKFERLIFEIESKLRKDGKVNKEYDVRIRTENNGLRQVDVLITHEMNGLIFKTAIECKEYKRAVGLKDIDSFIFALKDIKASSGILVAKSGFTAECKKRAKEYNIALYNLSEIPHSPKEDGTESAINIFYYYHVQFVSQKIDIKFEKELPEPVNLSLDTVYRVESNNKEFTFLQLIDKDLQRRKDDLIKLLAEINSKHSDPEVVLQLGFKFIRPVICVTQNLPRVLSFNAEVKVNLKFELVENQKEYEYIDTLEDKLIAKVQELSHEDLSNVFVESTIDYGSK